MSSVIKANTNTNQCQLMLKQAETEVAPPLGLPCWISQLPLNNESAASSSDDGNSFFLYPFKKTHGWRPHLSDEGGQASCKTLCRNGKVLS